MPVCRNGVVKDTTSSLAAVMVKGATARSASYRTRQGGTYPLPGIPNSSGHELYTSHFPRDMCPETNPISVPLGTEQPSASALRGRASLHLPITPTSQCADTTVTESVNAIPHLTPSPTPERELGFEKPSAVTFRAAEVLTPGHQVAAQASTNRPLQLLNLLVQ